MPIVIFPNARVQPMQNTDLAKMMATCRISTRICSVAETFFNICNMRIYLFSFQMITIGYFLSKRRHACAKIISRLELSKCRFSSQAYSSLLLEISMHTHSNIIKQGESCPDNHSTIELTTTNIIYCLLKSN